MKDIITIALWISILIIVTCLCILTKCMYELIIDNSAKTTYIYEVIKDLDFNCK